MRSAIVALSLALTATLSLGAQTMRAPRNLAEFDELFNKISNWGRWGKDDELGAANLVTDAKRRQAAALVKTGVSVSLAHDFDNAGPPMHVMSKPLPDDIIVDSYQLSGHAMTHLDAFCHVGYKGRVYNGHKLSDVVTGTSCTKLAISVFKRQGVLTRGVLMDMPRLKGLPYLEPATPIYAEDLDAWERQAGVKVTSGDAVLLRTGRWARQAKVGVWEFFKQPEGKNAGLHPSAAPWFKARDVAFLLWDVQDGYQPLAFEGVPYPFHTLMLTALGVAVMDGVDMEELSETAARLKRWEFMLSAAPLPMKGGTGSPINPIAVF